MRVLLPLVALSLLATACKDEKGWNVGGGSSTPPYERLEGDPTLLGNTVVAVRVGELGPSFAACNSEGAARDFAGAEPIGVRAAPFEQARETGRLAAGSRFFICSRSIDQRWLGIVFDASGQANRSCGVSAPIGGRRDYEGPCDSGWVPSARVQLVSGPEEPPVQSSQNVGEPK